MTATLLRETARLLINHTLRLPERVARQHVGLLGGQTPICVDGAFANATLTLTKAGAFLETVCDVGTILYLHDNGSDEVEPGYYTIVERTSDDAVVLDRDLRPNPGAAPPPPDPTDVVVFLGQLATFAAIHLQRQTRWKELVLGQLPAIRQPVYPAAADTWHTAGDYGPNADDYTPVMRASDIANCEPGNVKLGVAIDDVTGTFAGP